MSVKVTNNATTTLSASIGTTDLTLSVLAATGTQFPNLVAGDWFWATLANAAGALEIVKVTSKAGDVFTIVRAQDGTGAGNWNPGDKVELRPTAALFNDKLGVADALAQYSPIAWSLQVPGRNRIINGSCLSALLPGISCTGNANYFGGPDCYPGTNAGAGGAFTLQQANLNPFNGVSYPCVSQNVSSVMTNGSGSLYWGGICQSIEGVDSYDLYQQPMAISFLFQAFLAGVYSVSIALSNGYSYVTTFNHAVSGVVQRVQISIPACPASTQIVNTGAIGVTLRIGAFNSGTLSTAVANAWQNTAAICSSTATAWPTNASGYIAASQIKLEKGAVCTPFEDEPFQVNFARISRRIVQMNSECRYFQNTAASAGYSVNFPVPMRAVPSVTSVAGTTINSGAPTATPTSGSSVSFVGVTTATGAALWSAYLFTFQAQL